MPPPTPSTTSLAAAAGWGVVASLPSSFIALAAYLQHARSRFVLVAFRSLVLLFCDWRRQIVKLLKNVQCMNVEIRIDSILEYSAVPKFENMSF